MADINEHVAYLSQEIGPRPAGTEEEQRAALYISECLSKETGFATSLEDFQCNPDSTLPRGLSFGVAVLVTLLATVLPMLVVPAVVVGFLCAALWAAEVFNKPIFSRFLNRGVSQNVVAKYIPVKSATRATRRRKVIIVANYDSGKVRRDLNSLSISMLPALYWAEFAMLVVMPVLLIVRFALNAEGTLLIVCNVLLAVAMVVAVLPVISLVLEKTASYNEGANCNAAGVATLIDVAARVAAARDIPDAEEPFIHGEEAARSAGLVPDGADVVYDLSSTGSDLGASMESAAQRLAAAKAAVAALSGKPVNASEPQEEKPESPADNDQQQADASPESKSDADTVDAPAADIDVPVAPAPAVAPVAETVKPSVPDWFVKAQEQAKKPRVEKPAQRSRYADALATAEEEIAARTEAQKTAEEELSARMRTMRESVQAASEAAGATPTGIIPNAADAAASSTGLVEGPAPRPSAPTPTAVSDSAAPAPVVPIAAAPAPEAPSEPTPASAAALEPVSVADTPSAPASPALSSVPEVLSAPDEPDVILREGSRPLTGSIPAVAPAAPAAPASATEAGRRLVVPEVEADSAAAVSVAPQATPHRKRRAISLPNIGISQELPRISMDDRQQAAPLAEERRAGDGRVHDLSAVIPSVAAPNAASPESALMGALPSLGGTPTAIDPGLSGSINLAGSFSSMGATGAAEPIGEELLAAASADELYIQDVDDSAYAQQVTETGAMAGPGYVEMPKSRFGRLFGKKRHKNRDEELTPQQWLDVEDDFEAQEVGAARGSWESFREDAAAEGQTTAFGTDYLDDAFTDDDFGTSGSARHGGRRFEGGAFSRVRKGDEYFEEEPSDSESAPLEAASPFADVLPEGFLDETTSQIQHIEQFRHKRIDMEVWFVALGAELAGNGGMRAFLETHAEELKGSIFVELEALGAGELTLIDKEGTYLSKKASSRMRRLVKKAGQAVGLSVPSATMTWRDSASAYAMKHGEQALHVAGMADRKPAFFAEADDVVENVDNDQISLNADFTMSLLQNI